MGTRKEISKVKKGETRKVQDGNFGDTAAVRLPFSSAYICPAHLAIGRLVRAAASSLDPAVRKTNKGNATDAQKVGELIAKKVKALGIDEVAFDRSGYKYHGRVKALADAARASGLKF